MVTEKLVQHTPRPWTVEGGHWPLLRGPEGELLAAFDVGNRQNDEYEVAS